VRDYCWIVPRTASGDSTVASFCRWLEQESGQMRPFPAAGLNDNMIAHAFPED